MHIFNSMDCELSWNFMGREIAFPLGACYNNYNWVRWNIVNEKTTACHT